MIATGKQNNVHADAVAPRRRDAVPGIPLVAVPALVMTVVLVGGGLFGAMWTSLHPGAIVGGEFGFDAWIDSIGDPALRTAALRSVLLAMVTTALSLPVAILLGGFVRRSRLALVVTGLPIAVPHLVVGVSMVVVFGPGGLLDRTLGGVPVQIVGDPNGVGIVLGYMYKEIPFLALIVLAGWDKETDDLLDAAVAFGANRWRCIRDVLIPRLAPGLAAGSAVVSAFVVGAAEIPLLLGTSRHPTLATYAIDVTRIDGPAARPVAGAILLGAAVASFAVAAVMLGLGARWSRVR